MEHMLKGQKRSGLRTITVGHRDKHHAQPTARREQHGKETLHHPPSLPPSFRHREAFLHHAPSWCSHPDRHKA